MKNSKHRVHIRLICAVLALIFLFGAVPVQGAVSGAAEENSLLYNGSFDLPYKIGQNPSGWNLNANNANHKAQIQSEVVYGNSGNALKIQATGQSYIWATDFAVEAGATYLMSYYIRVDRAEGLQYAPFFNDHNCGGSWWKDFAVAPVTGVTDGWTRISGTVTIPETVGTNPENGKNQVQLGFKVYSGSGTFYLDQVSFVKTQIHLQDPNLNFEHIDPVSGNLLNWASKSQGLTVEHSGEIYHDGSNSMYLQKDSLAEKSYAISTVHLPVETGKIYEFSFWLSSCNADPTATIRMHLTPYRADGTAMDKAVLGTVSALNGSAERSDWTKVVTRGEMPEEAAYVTLGFAATRGKAHIWLDDLAFRIVEDGVDCVVYYEDFHAVDEKGNVGPWRGNGSFTAENGGKLTATGAQSYVYNRLDCLMTDYTYCIKGNYTADIGGKVEVRFYDYQHKEYENLRQTMAIMAGGTALAGVFTAPSHTYAAIYIITDQSGSITMENLAIYMTAEPAAAEKNYLDADWTAKADRDNVVSSVEVYNGVPTLMIDGEPTASMFYLRPDLDAYLQTDAESRIFQSGLELYITYGGNLYKGGCDPIWLEDGSIDYAAFDAVIYDTLAASDDALVMVHIGMFAPQWWLEQNPEHQAQAHNGSEYIPLGDASLASEKFREEAGQVLRQLIGHMKQQNYYNRVFGLKISGGQSYEWMHWGTGADQGVDYSSASQAGFQDYLKKKYGTDEALQAAWGNPNVTFESAAAPQWEERCASENVYLGDADTGVLSRNMVDWNLWLNEASADSFLYYCRIAKEETDGQIIVGGYNGYLWTSNTYDSQGKAHTAVDRVLDSEYVDWIASPIAYNERLLGQSGTYMALLDSVQAHGKLYIAEQDNRTCLADSYAGNSWDADWDYQVGQTRTMADTIYQQKRDFANALVNGAGLWQFDMYGGWLDDEQLYDYFRDAKAEYDLSVQLPRNTVNEIAVFVADESYAYLTAENKNMSFTLLEPMLQQQRKHLGAMGAGYDTYAMSTLLEGKVPPHKLNIVLSPFEVTEQMQEAIDTYLKTNHQVVVWVYLAGISDGKQLSLENMERTTGFSMGLVEEKSTLQVQIADVDHTLTKNIAGLTYGNSVADSVSPRPYLQDTAGASVLGYHLDGGEAALAVKDMGDWTSVYSAAPCLDVAFLRNLMDLAGCHVYSENNADVIYSSGSYVALHSGTAGEKTIYLTGNFAVYDVFEERFVSQNTNVINYMHSANDTHIFRLTKANTYAVTASVDAGKGSISPSGLTQISSGGSYTLTVLPECGYEIGEVTVNGTAAALENGVLQIPAVASNTAIQVKFQKQKHPQNGGFESGSFGGDMTGSGSVSVVSDANVHSGMYSLRLNRDESGRDLVKLQFRLNPANVDRRLTVTFYAKTATGAVRALHTGAHFFTADWKTTQSSFYSAVYPPRDAWTSYTQSLTIPAGTEILQYQFYADTENADIFIDDISVCCDGKEMMVNGTLERGNLTGSFDDVENTPQLVMAQNVHSGSYAASLKKGGGVSASVDGLKLRQAQQGEFKFYLRSAISTSQKLSYTLTALEDGQQIYQTKGEIKTSGRQWQEYKLAMPLPENTQSVVLQLTSAGAGTVYLDDVQWQVSNLEALDIRFQEVYSDGTWRLISENMDKLTEAYYKLPVVIDGQAGYVIAHNTAGMLCIYPSFFTVFGMQVPQVSFTIDQGSVMRAVDANGYWQEMPAAQAFKVAQPVQVYPAGAYVKCWNISLGGDLTANFYVSMEEDRLQNSRINLAVAGENHVFSVAEGQYDSQLQAYRFSVSLAAAQMCDEICVQLISDGSAVTLQSYTLRQYALTVLDDEAMQPYHPMVTRMLIYGGAAQRYFGYGLEHLADAGISGETGLIPQEIEPVTVEGNIANLQFYGASLVYREKVSVRYYFTAQTVPAGLVCTIGGTPCEILEKNGMYFVESEGIYPQHWDQSLSLMLRDGNGNTITVDYNPMNYMARMYEKGTDQLQSLLSAMYHYHITAKALIATP